MALREIIARFGFQIDQRGLKKAETGVGRVVGQLKAMGVMIGAGMVARGIKNFVTGMVDAGDALGKTATQLGLSSDQLQAWQAAAGYAGVEGAKFSQSMRVMQKNALLAEQGSKQAGDAFKKLGVDFKDTNGQLKTGDKLMREVGLALNKTENSTERVALAQQLMGRTGAALLPLFKDGEKGLDAALAALERFGGGMSKEMVKNAEEAQDRFADLNIATTSLKSQLAVALLPVISQMALGLAKLFAWISKSAHATEYIRTAVVSLAFVLTKLAIMKWGAQFMQLARAMAWPLAKFLLLYFIVDDLIALFQGRGSVIGTFIDKIFGKGSAKALIEGIKGVGAAFKGLLASGDWAAFDKQLEDIFGPPGMALVEGAISIFDTVALAIGKFIVEGVRSIGQFFTDLGTSFSAGATALVTAATELAESIVDGIVDGIKAGAKAVKDELVGIAKGALKAAKDLIGAKSPSKVFAVEVGAPIVQGIAMGAKGAAGAAGRITGDAIAAASGVGAKTLSAPARGGGGGGIAGGVVFKSDINLTVSGGSPGDPQIAKLRQGVRSELRDNRRATLDALHQLVEAPA